MQQQISTSVQSSDFVAYIGIDWADKGHAICLQADGESRVKHQEIEHSPESLNKWVGELHQRFGDGPIAVCLEQSKGSLINFLIHPGNYDVHRPLALGERANSLGRRDLGRSVALPNG